MKCVAKTVSGATAEIDVEPTDTLADLKTKIEAKLESAGPVSKVIHKGKVLEDGKAVSEYGVAEADTFVVMVNKAKPKPAAPVEPAPDAVPKPVAPTAAAAVPAPAAAAPAASPEAPAGGAEGPSYESSASTLVVGEEVEATIMQIMEMGFERDLVMKAMRAAFMNPDRAVEYLMTGIPEQPQAPPQGAPAAPGGRMGGEDGGGAVDPALMAALQQQMLGAQEGPQLLQPLLEQIGQQHPEVLEAIQSNQDEFVRLINEPIDPAHLAQAQMAMQAMGGGGIGGLLGMGGGGEGGDGSVQIHLTPEEGEALARLEALGFPRQVALEAYLACDKKEEIAANYLFENGMDDGE